MFEIGGVLRPPGRGNVDAAWCSPTEEIDLGICGLGFAAPSRPFVGLCSKYCVVAGVGSYGKVQNQGNDIILYYVFYSIHCEDSMDSSSCCVRRCSG